MRLEIPLAAAALLASGHAAATPTKCNADNCLRALRATQIPGRLDDAAAFCSSFTAVSGAAVPIPTYVQNGCNNNKNTGGLESRISSACACLGHPTTTTSTSSTATTTTSTTTTTLAAPCAQISASWASQVKQNPRLYPTVPATLAYECITSVPLDQTRALAIVDALEPYLEWQSDIDYLKNPPSGYYYPGYDVSANIKAIRTKVVAGKYTNEYELQSDIQEKIYFPGHDGHFWLSPASLNVFAFNHPRGLVSFTEDGHSLPVIKVYEDVKSSPQTASVLKTINGVDAASFVQDLADSASYSHGVDTVYNGMFYSSSLIGGRSGQFGTGGLYSYLYRGANTTFGFENGTTVTYENKAKVTADLTGVVDGLTFKAKFCDPLPPAPPSNPSVNVLQLTAYPKPVIATSDNVVTGYYLDDPSLSNVAVVVLRNFEPANVKEFQTVFQDFLTLAHHDGKTKLVLDFQGNNGGYILLGYDMFRQLFPQIQEDGFSRWRASQGFLDIAKAFSDEFQNFDAANSADADEINDSITWFNFQFDLNVTRQNFQTFADKFTPHIYQETPYTNNMAWNLSNELLTGNTTFGLGTDVSGYRSRTNLTQFFKAEDIVALYDGNCASTCTIAGEMLRHQGGVKAITLGGRPREGPTQHLGAIKGSQVLDYGSIYYYAQEAIKYTKDPAVKARLSRFVDVSTLRLEGSVNVRDAILSDHINDGVPAQYLTEDSDCRLYWTKPMLDSITEVWKAAASSAFYGQKCNYGGIERTAQSAQSAQTAQGTAQGFRQPGSPKSGPAPIPASSSMDKTPDSHVKDPRWQARFNVRAKQ